MLLAIEGGGTKTRILLAQDDGAVVARELGGPASVLYLDPKAFAREMLGILHRMRQVADRAGGRVERVGLAGPMERPLVEDLVRAAFGPVAFIGAGESEIALSLHYLTWGVSLVAGTGASCRGINRRGEHVSRGGFGPQFGDEGSGAWIGREAVSAVMRADDGREETTLLKEKLLEAYRVQRAWDMFQFVDQSGHVSATKIAAFVPFVFDAARSGDAVARRICRRAGRELGRLVAAVAQGLTWEETPVPLVLTGGVFNGGALILTPLRRVLLEHALDMEMRPPVAEPAEGLLRFMMRNEKQTA